MPALSARLAPGCLELGEASLPHRKAGLSAVGIQPWLSAHARRSGTMQVTRQKARVTSPSALHSCSTTDVAEPCWRGYNCGPWLTPILLVGPSTDAMTFALSRHLHTGLT